MLNNVGLKLSPCFTPRVVKNGSLYESPTLHEYNVLEYISLIKLEKVTPNALEINKVISFNQGGFRSGYRTTDHIFIWKTLINKYLHKLKSKLYVCFVDLKKAFDSIDRNALFQKIENKGIGGNLMSSTNMLNNVGLNLSPCFTPRVVKNGSLYESPN
jgi:hypothetical protein